MIPEKLEAKPIYGSTTFDIYENGHFLGVMSLDSDAPIEIVRRYNGYTTQQKLIEQCMEVCEEVLTYLNTPYKSKYGNVEIISLLQNALLATKEQMKGNKNG